MYTVIGNQNEVRAFSANAEDFEEALYVAESFLRRAGQAAATVEIFRGGGSTPYLTLDLDAFRPTTVTDADMRFQVTQALAGDAENYDVAAIVDELQRGHGTVHIDTIAPVLFWGAVLKHEK